MKVRPPLSFLADLHVHDHAGCLQGVDDLAEPRRLLVAEAQEEDGRGITGPDVPDRWRERPGRARCGDGEQRHDG
jgi:hypothetical protein